MVTNKVKADMEQAPLPHTEVKHLRFLRVLVTTLTVTMIVGLVTIVALLVIRLAPASPPAALALPDVIVLPDGARAVAFTMAARWYAVVTAQDKILIYARDSGELLQVISVPVQ